MRINKDFAVIVNGKQFNAFDIREIHINGGAFKMICELGDEATETIECKTRNVEFASMPQANGFDGAGFFDLGVRKIKENDDMRNAIRQAVREVMEEDAINRVRGKKEKFPMDRKEFEEMTKKYQGR